MIRLTGRLVCADEDQTRIVREHLLRHAELTRAEDGCLSFEVEATENPLVWDVHEEFADREAFDAHQVRVRSSEWGRVTTAIARDYVVEAVDR